MSIKLGDTGGFRPTQYDKERKQKASTMNNSSLYAPIYDQAVMMHELVFHNTDGTEQSKRYTYKSAIAVEEGDTVVMQARGWFAVGTVKKCNVSIPFDEAHDFKWIIAKIDTHAADTLQEWEATLVEEINRKRAENMRQQLIDNLGVQPNQITSLMSRDDRDVIDAVLDKTQES